MVVEGESGIFPSPVARLLRWITGRGGRGRGTGATVSLVLRPHAPVDWQRLPLVPPELRRRVDAWLAAGSDDTEGAALAAELQRVLGTPVEYRP